MNSRAPRGGVEGKKWTGDSPHVRPPVASIHIPGTRQHGDLATWRPDDLTTRLPGDVTLANARQRLPTNQTTEQPTGGLVRFLVAS